MEAGDVDAGTDAGDAAEDAGDAGAADAGDAGGDGVEVRMLDCGVQVQHQLISHDLRRQHGKLSLSTTLSPHRQTHAPCRVAGQTPEVLIVGGPLARPISVG